MKLESIHRAVQIKRQAIELWPWYGLAQVH